MPADVQPLVINISKVTEEEALQYGKFVEELGEEYSFWVNRDDPNQPQIGYQWLSHSGVYKLILNVILKIPSPGESRAMTALMRTWNLGTHAGLSISLSRSDPYSRKGGYFQSKGIYVPHHRRKSLDKGQYFDLFEFIHKNRLENSFSSTGKTIAKICGKFLPLFVKAFHNIYDCIGQERVEHHELHTDVSADEGTEQWLKVGKLLEEHYASRNPD